jgi:integrase
MGRQLVTHEEKSRCRLFLGTLALEYRNDALIQNALGCLRPKPVHCYREFNLSHLKPVFGTKLVVDITPSAIAKYQKKRLAEGASPRTVNIEVGTLRAILRERGVWAKVQKKVKMVPLGENIGRAISSAEEQVLLDACGKSRSRSLLPLSVLAIETGARFNTLRTLQWNNVDFAERSLRFGKDKTKAGTSRSCRSTSAR